jgi:MFS family permease
MTDTTTTEHAVPAITIAGIALASALVPLNSTMIAVALPDIARHFDITTSHASVLITLYLVAMLVGQPLAGRVGDALGARRLATIAVSGFGICSLGAVVAPSFGVLVGLRALQAACAAALSPSVQAMLRDAVPPSERGRAFGLQSSVIGVGAGLGPVIGGLATSAFGWRAIFGVNLPIVLAVLYVLRRYTSAPSTEASGAASPEGARGGRPAASASRDRPVARPRIFNRSFNAAFATQALSTFAQYALLLAVPIVLDGRGWSAATIGAALTALTLGMVVMGPFGGRQGDLTGRRRPVVVGLGVALVAVGVAMGFGDDVPSWLLVTTLLAFGLGLGVATPSIMTAGIESAPEGRIGAAAGVLSASRYVGSIAATLVLAGVIDDDGHGLSTMLLLCAGIMVPAIASARWLPGRRPAMLEPVG